MTGTGSESNAGTGAVVERDAAPLAQPLAPEDVAILALESNTIVGHVCRVILVDGSLTREALLDRLAGRLSGLPLLTCRLEERPEGYFWVTDPHFDLEHHVSAPPVLAPLDRNGLCDAVAQLFEQHLDRSQALWSISLFALEEGRSALVWRIHHALADGTTAVKFAERLLWDSTDPVVTAARSHAGHDAVDSARRRNHLAAFLTREFGRQHGSSPFDGTVGTKREVGLVETSLTNLRQSAKAVDGATVNDAILAVVAGALRRWIEHHHGRLNNVRVRVPVSLHSEHDEVLNRDSYFSLQLPLREVDPLARLRAVQRATSRRKAESDAEHLDVLYQDLASLSPRLRQFAANLEDSPRRFALSVSNVPGPRAPVAMLGMPVTGIFGLAEIGERHALRISVHSNADRLCFGLCADPQLVPDLQRMASAVADEAEALVAATTSAQRG
jgi:diacylglycerol O-acyltransferase / wax synthase